jgi:hypothetical protein
LDQLSLIQASEFIVAEGQNIFAGCGLR